MKLGIIGLPQSGKTTIFEALTHNFTATAHKGESRIGTIKVPDQRIDRLSQMYNPKKTIYAQVEYFLPSLQGQGSDKPKDQSPWTQVRDSDALIHVVRNFGGYGFEAPDIRNDYHKLDQELILADLLVAEKRLERLEIDQKRSKNANPEELNLLQQCHTYLEQEIPLRKIPELASAHLLRGYAFLSAKPTLVLLNNEDEDDQMPALPESISAEQCVVIRGKLEQELGQMEEDEAQAFLDEFNIAASAMDLVVKRSYDLLGLISFFTVGDDEVRAWTIKKDTLAVDAAEVIHSDMKKGFIRAEVLSYDDLMDAGTYAEARKKGTFRLEGKTYPVQDGDIISFRFNV